MDDGTEGSEIKFLDNLDIKVDIETLIIDERVDNRYEKTIELSQRRIFEPELDTVVLISSLYFAFSYSLTLVMN